jgi:thiamine-monophosphate kinase
VTEFELIARFFANQPDGPDSPGDKVISAAGLQKDQDVQLGIGDDCALLRLDNFCSLAVSVDSQVEGKHFPVHYAPGLVASRSMGAAVSDLAAMGATPVGCLLALTLPKADAAWLAVFSAEVHRLSKRWQIPLIGGDTTAGPLQVSITVLGKVDSTRVLRRSGARVGDDIWVSGFLGEASAALRYLDAETKGQLPDAVLQNAYCKQLLQRYHHPEPRLELGSWLLGKASAAVDVSDGLVADLGHLCNSSAVGARLVVDSLPVSASLDALLCREDALHQILYGGDDYELCFTAGAEYRQQIADSGFVLHRIGEITAGRDISLLLNGIIQQPAHTGFDHFRKG